MMAPEKGALGELRDRLSDLEKCTANNTAAICRVEGNTREMLDVFESFRGAFKVLEMIGKVAKALVSIVTLGSVITGLWMYLRGLWK